MTADPFSLETHAMTLGKRKIIVSQIAARDMLTMQRADGDNRLFRLIAASVTVDGQPVTAEDVGRWPMATVNALLPHALRLNGLETEPAEAQDAGNDPATAAA